MVGPFSSGSGYLVMTQGLTQGATIYIESKFVPERALDLLTRHRISSFMGAPIFFERDGRTCRHSPTPTYRISIGPRSVVPRQRRATQCVAKQRRRASTRIWLDGSRRRLGRAATLQSPNPTNAVAAECFPSTPSD